MSPQNEWRTRKERIDAKLRGLSQPWRIIRYRDSLDTKNLHAVAVEEFPTDSGPADYALFVQGRLLGFIEAKKTAVGAENVLEQAKRYAKTTRKGSGNWRGYRVPFLYSSNGEQVYFIDVRPDQSYSRQVSNFHTVDALQEFFDRKLDATWFTRHAVDNPRLRYYQRKPSDARSGRSSMASATC